MPRRRAAGHHRLHPGARAKGFRNAIESHDNIEIARSQTGGFTRSGGKKVMESFLQAEDGGENVCALYAHNDDMALGAIQAIKEAGLNPGEDIKVVPIDAVPDIFKAVAEGDANATVELTPNIAGPAFDALEAGAVPAKSIQTASRACRSSSTETKIETGNRLGVVDPRAVCR